MNKVLNHLYYSYYCWIYWSWTIFDVKKKNKNFNIFGEVEATVDSPSLYVLTVALYLYWFVVLFAANINDFFVVECVFKSNINFFAFVICFLVGGIICYYYSFRGKRYLKYFKKFRKQDDLTRFWWHALSLMEIVLLVFVWIIILRK